MENRNGGRNRQQQTGAGALVKGIIGSLVVSVAVLGGAGSALASSVEPKFIEGNPSCADLDESFSELKLEDDKGQVTSGVHTDGTLTVEIDLVELTQTFDWWEHEPMVGVDAVIVKGSNSANVYGYDPEANSDTGLNAPAKNELLYFEISHISFCYDAETPPDDGGDTPDDGGDTPDDGGDTPDDGGDTPDDGGDTPEEDGPKPGGGGGSDKPETQVKAESGNRLPHTGGNILQLAAIAMVMTAIGVALQSEAKRRTAQQ